MIFEVRHFTKICDIVFLILKFEFKKGAVFQNTRKSIKLLSKKFNKSNKSSENNSKFGLKTVQMSIE